jgi:hypothetical protein
VHFYKEFQLDEQTGIVLNVSVPIEAKWRKDIEAFGIRLPPESYMPRVPVASALYGSSLGYAVLLPEQPFHDAPLTRLVFLEIEEGKTPKKIHKENLIFNVSSKLFDFSKFDFTCHDSQIGRDFVVRHKLLNRFDYYLREKNYAWWSELRGWMDENLTEATCNTFNKNYFVGRRVFFTVRAHLPILCVNMPLHEVVESKDNLLIFKNCDWMVSRVRVPSWPGPLRTRLIRYTVEPPLVITNLAGLPLFLQKVFSWFLEIEQSLRRTKPQVKKRWPLEASFFQAAVNKYMQDQEEGEIRSDLDAFDLII